MSAPEDSLLRPALELALAVARAGEEEDPAEPAPVPLRPFLRFTHRVPAQVLGPARRALEDDERFRSRVAEVASEPDVGRASWLFLVRPDGWREELAGLAAATEAAVTAETEEREERSARRRLPKEEQARRKAEADAAAARDEARRAATRLGDERRARRDAEQLAAELRARVTSAEADGAAARSALDQAAARLQLLEARVVELEDLLALTTARLEEARAEAAAAGARAEVAATPVARGPELDRAALATAVRAAAEAAARMGKALADVARLVGPARPDEPAPGPASAGDDPVTAAPAVTSPAAARPRRRPLALPPAVFDDSDEAAHHLVRHPGVTLLVDGYNASHELWDGLAPPEQRRRLVDALVELAARTGVDVEVVFDGAADAGPPLVPTTNRHRVRVRFSPPGVEADDVVIERAGELPVDHPVVVASSDRRVQDGARRHGANVISSAQLAALLRARR